VTTVLEDIRSCSTTQLSYFNVYKAEAVPQAMKALGGEGIAPTHS
jgi:hypothetical protein